MHGWWQQFRAEALFWCIQRRGTCPSVDQPHCRCSFLAALPPLHGTSAPHPLPPAAGQQVGGLADIKAARIQAILDTLAAERGALSLEYLRALPTPEVSARGWRSHPGFPGFAGMPASCRLATTCLRPASCGLPACRFPGRVG